MVKDALLDTGHPVNISIGPHQMRKLGASHSRNVGHNEELLKNVMGFSSVSILRKNYIPRLPPLTIAGVLPGSPYLPPVGTEMAASDSD